MAISILSVSVECEIEEDEKVGWKWIEGRKMDLRWTYRDGLKGGPQVV